MNDKQHVNISMINRRMSGFCEIDNHRESVYDFR